jgi:hypothetical protein
LEALKGIKKRENQNELLKQIEERKLRVEAQKQREKQDDMRLDQKVREDLKRLNQREQRDINRERGKPDDLTASMDNSVDLSR